MTLLLYAWMVDVADTFPSSLCVCLLPWKPTFCYQFNQWFISVISVYETGYPIGQYISAKLLFSGCIISIGFHSLRSACVSLRVCMGVCL